MKKIKIKEVCNYNLFDKIKRYAKRSIYKMNSGSADCYAFSIDADGKDWVGGWDWSNDLIDKNAEFILMLDSGEVFKI